MLGKLWGKPFKRPIIFFLISASVLIVVIWAAMAGFLGSRARETVVDISKITSVNRDVPGQKSTIDAERLRQGCYGKDCIPSIDNPKFISADQGSGYLKDDDVVFGIDLNGIVRAYPQKILNWHEVVNDTIDGQPVVISFCPLCGTAIAHERIVKDQTVEFGVSGKLLQSNLVMYDRLTETLWVQATGEAIAGELVGGKLKQVPLMTTFWGTWSEVHPDTQVLSTDTGFSRNYNSYPYGDYETSKEFLFKPDKLDDRLHPKVIGYGVEIGGKFKFYPEEVIKSIAIVDQFAARKLQIKREAGGGISITDLNSGESINYLRSMWFSWFAFHPETELFFSSAK